MTFTKMVQKWACALFAAGTLAGANAAMTGTAWNDEAGFLSRMIEGEYFSKENPSFDSGTIFTDSQTGYGYTVGISRGVVKLSFHSPPLGPAPTGVGGFFTAVTDQTEVTFFFSDAFDHLTTVKVKPDPLSGFAGYTTDVDPNVLSIKALSFSGFILPSHLYVGLDTVLVVPEPTTMVAGGLLLVPLGATFISRFRKRL